MWCVRARTRREMRRVSIWNLFEVERPGHVSVLPLTPDPRLGTIAVLPLVWSGLRIR